MVKFVLPLTAFSLVAYAQFTTLPTTSGGGGGSPTGTASGALAGAYPNPKLRDFVNLKDYGATCDNVASDNAAFAAALAAFPTGNVTINVPNTCRIVSTVTISTSYTYIQGIGAKASNLTYAPSGSGPAFLFSTGGVGDIVGGGIANLNIYSADTTLQKTAIDIRQGNGTEVKDVRIWGAGTSGTWSGASSIGLRLRGHQLIGARRSDIWADIPIQIEPNPNLSSNALDHSNFQNLYLIANGNPIINVLSNAPLTNVIFDGYQAWALGTYGFYMNDVVNSTTSQNIKFQNVRWEQASANNNVVYVNRVTSGMANISLDNIAVSGTAKGLFCSGCDTIGLANYSYVGGSDGLNVSNGTGFSSSNAFLQTGSTATVTTTANSGSYRIGTAVTYFSAPLASPTFTGTVTAPTLSAGSGGAASGAGYWSVNDAYGRTFEVGNVGFYCWSSNGFGTSGSVDTCLTRNSAGVVDINNGTANTGGGLNINGLKSTTGTRYLCIGTTGTVTSSATACSGT